MLGLTDISYYNQFMKISIQPLVSRPKQRTIVLCATLGQTIIQHPFFKGLPAAVQQTARAFVRSKEFKGQTDEVRVIPFGTSANTLMLFGLGKQQEWSHRSAILASRQIIMVAKQHRLSELGIYLPDLVWTNAKIEDVSQVVSENAQLAHYEYSRYKSAPPEGWPRVSKLFIYVGPKDLRAAKLGANRGEIISDAVNHARDLANTPGGDMTPESVAADAVKLSKQHGVKVQVLHKADLEKLGAGGILGVARGSDLPPTLTIMEYTASGHEKDAPLVFVGKGVTFDSGGLNVKPDSSMYEMHMDMSGGAAVIAALAAIAQLKLPLRVIGLVPAAENMSAGSAYRPGDQLKSLSGKTIEVMHTDAEGRILLADALTYAERYKPQAVIDVATLTGAAVVALGQRAAAILSPDEKLSMELHKLAESSGDFAWPLPLWQEYESEIKGTFGDYSNTGKYRLGGAITAAAFLWQFAKKLKHWAHIDIAPTMTSIEGQHLAKGATGAGVRLLVAFARKQAE
jgi:leucyl aminopeptidase